MATNNVALIQLPQEIIERILMDEQLTLKDVVNFTSTCKTFYYTNKSTKFWMTKRLKEWPTLRDNYCLMFKNTTGDDWCKVIRNYSSVRNDLMLDIKETSKNDYLKEWLRRIDLFKQPPSIDHENSLQLAIMLDVIHEWLNNKRTSNLSHCFHANHMLIYLHRKFLIFKYKLISSIPSETFTLELFMIFASEWTYPKEQMLRGKTLLMIDEIVKQIEENLRFLNPSHSIFRVDKKIREKWQFENITDNQFGFKESQQTLASICDVLFGQLGFTVYNFEYYYAVREYISIDKVLEKKIGMRMIVSIIFVIIAQRLGVLCKYTADNAVHWTETSSSPSRRCYMVKLNETQTRIKPSLVFNKTKNYLLSSCLKECEHKAASFAFIGSQLTEFDFDYENHSDMERIAHSEKQDFTLLNRMIANIPVVTCYDSSESHNKMIYDERRFLGYKRGSNVKYAIGMIVRKKFVAEVPGATGPDKLVVITGWTYDSCHFDDPEDSRDAIYYVLSDSDFEIEWVKQDDLSLADVSEIRAIKSELIGKYFTEFKGLYYQPVTGLDELYSYDSKFREKFVENCEKELLMKNKDNK